jgi:hypothetical protein
MANPEHLAKLLKRAQAWNRWRKNNPDVRPDLSGADLGGADLSTMYLRGADLSGTHLSAADLSEANLIGADLVDADLRGAELAATDLSWALLRGTDLSGANLSMANLSETNLRTARLRKVGLGFTIFANVDLSRNKDLDKCDHRGPSTIGIDTIHRSKGDIPETFLRGAGVPEPFINYSRSLVDQAIDSYSCLISYSSEDQSLAELLHADLTVENHRCWFSAENLKTGKRFQERIEESIRRYDRVIIVLSEASVKSRWVEREIEAIGEREIRENRTILLPIRIDDAVMNNSQPWAVDIRRELRRIDDFTDWNDSYAYRNAFKRLLRDLKADVAR